MSAELLVAGLALIGIVIVVSALLSGLIDRSGLPQVAVFIAIGAALGPAGLGVFNTTLDSPVLRVVATLSLTLVLFTDAVSLNTKEVRRRSGLTFRMLGPGTIVCAALTAVAAWWLLKVPPASAAILGAALASTDPVLLRGLLRRRDLPEAARQALQLESGLNDVVLLPIVVIALALTGSGYTTEIFRAGLGAVDRGQMEAARSIGLSRLRTYGHVILPQMFRIVVPPLGNTFVGLLKGATIMAVIAVPDMVFLANELNVTLFTPFEVFAAVGILLVVMVLFFSAVVYLLERRLRAT